jgi:hypothetical protein
MYSGEDNIVWEISVVFGDNLDCKAQAGICFARHTVHLSEAADTNFIARAKSMVD